MKKIVKNFLIKEPILVVTDHANGLVNKTYLVETINNKYIMQRINKYVFKKPADVMNNIVKITKHLQRKNQSTLSIIKTNKGGSYYYDGDNYYRCYRYLNGKKSFETAEDYHQCLEAGRIIGKFQCLLRDFEPKMLCETIVDFHNTPKRIAQLEEAFFKCQNLTKIAETKELVSYIVDKKVIISEIQTKIDKGIIPIRVVHNDTKLNNVMFNLDNKASCLVDLDTVMPGIALFDYADAIRTTASLAKEDEKNIDLIGFNDQYFASLTVGYLSQMIDELTDIELSLLFNAIFTITIECAARFLTDYLKDDIYFKIDYPRHNLERAKSQLKLCEWLVIKEESWKDLIKQIVNHLKNR